MNGQENTTCQTKQSGPHLKEVFLKYLKDPKNLDNCDDIQISYHIENLTRYRLNKIILSGTTSPPYKQLAVDLLKLKPYSRLLLLYRNIQPGVKERMYKDIIKGHFKAEKTWLGLDILETTWHNRFGISNTGLRQFYRLVSGRTL